MEILTNIVSWTENDGQGQGQGHTVYKQTKI